MNTPPHFSRQYQIVEFSTRIYHVYATVMPQVAVVVVVYTVTMDGREKTLHEQTDHISNRGEEKKIDRSNSDLIIVSKL